LNVREKASGSFTSLDSQIACGSSRLGAQKWQAAFMVLGEKCLVLQGSAMKTEGEEGRGRVARTFVSADKTASPWAHAREAEKRAAQRSGGW
jgi:hypothetical protein